MSTGGESKLIRYTITGNRSKENISAASAICYMNETGIILSGAQRRTDRNSLEDG